MVGNVLHTQLKKASGFVAPKVAYLTTKDAAYDNMDGILVDARSGERVPRVGDPSNVTRGNFRGSVNASSSVSSSGNTNGTHADVSLDRALLESQFMHDTKFTASAEEAGAYLDLGATLGLGLPATVALFESTKREAREREEKLSQEQEQKEKHRSGSIGASGAFLGAVAATGMATGLAMLARKRNSGSSGNSSGAGSNGSSDNHGFGGGLVIGGDDKAAGGGVVFE